LKAQNLAILEGAMVVARETGADAILVAAGLVEEVDYLRSRTDGRVRVIGTAVSHDGVPDPERDLLNLPEVRLRRRGRAKIALLEGLAAGLLHPDERVVVISGDDIGAAHILDTIAVVDLGSEDDHLERRDATPFAALGGVGDPAAFDALLGLCVELGHAGREGKSVGLLVTIGDHEAVLRNSHPLVLNPFAGHPERSRCIHYPEARRAIVEFSGVDGAFVLRDDGVIVAAGRYLRGETPTGPLPSGLGARHRAAAGITAATRAIAFAVSETAGDTRVFAGGRIIMTIEGTD